MTEITKKPAAKGRRLRRSRFSPRYDQIFVVSNRSLAKVVAEVNSFLKEYGSEDIRHFASVMPVMIQDGKYIGQVIYSVKVGENERSE